MTIFDFSKIRSDRFRLGIDRSDYPGVYRVVGYELDAAGQLVAAASPAVLTAYDYDKPLPLPNLFELGSGAAQGLLDDLWRLGIRPSAGVAAKDDVVASQARHLEDLRTIAFHVLKIERT